MFLYVFRFWGPVAFVVSWMDGQGKARQGQAKVYTMGRPEGGGGRFRLG